jgi:carbon monoxide dehydrogenase subunit G
MLKKILIGVAAIIVLILVFAMTKPADFRVERTATINAPPETIHSYLIDFHKWGDWSPWEKLDPNMQRTFEGPPSGTGSVYSWSGNSDAGSGRMEITGVAPNRVNIKLDFISPIEAHDNVSFVLQPQGNATQVTWSMIGDNNYIMKLMQVFVSMDSMVGKDFESGLANLKTASEQVAAARSEAPAAP